VFKFVQKKSNKENEQNIAEAEEEEICENEEKHEELDSVKEDREDSIEFTLQAYSASKGDSLWRRATSGGEISSP